METHFLGIPFRDHSHRRWFLFTQSIFWLMFFFNAMVFFGETSIAANTITYSLIVTYLHINTSLKAKRLTNNGTMVNGMYSPDCIWYNRWMGIAYIVVVTLSTSSWLLFS